MKKIAPIIAYLTMVGAITVTSVKKVVNTQVSQGYVETVSTKQEELALGTSEELLLVDSTAYYDKYHYGHGADGRPLIEGLTLAGKREWLGMSAMLYDSDMNLLGIYEFRDTGYGQSTGQGNSTILKDKSIGTIENGTCIDVYFDTYEKCVEWGRRKVYMKLIESEG